METVSHNKGKEVILIFLYALMAQQLHFFLFCILIANNCKTATPEAPVTLLATRKLTNRNGIYVYQKQIFNWPLRVHNILQQNMFEKEAKL